MSFTVPEFAKDAAERAAKTFAQSALAVLGAGAVDIVHTNWVGILSVAGGAAVVSILSSVASGARDDTMSPASALKAAAPVAPTCAAVDTLAKAIVGAPTLDAKAAAARVNAAAAQTPQAVIDDLAATVAPAVFVTPVAGGNVVTTTTVPAVPVGNKLAPISRPGDTTTAAP